jgi:hypothetical protein
MFYIDSIFGHPLIHFSLIQNAHTCFPQIMDNPLKFNPSKIRATLHDLGIKLDGLDLDGAVLKFYEKIKGLCEYIICQVMTCFTDHLRVSGWVIVEPTDIDAGMVTSLAYLFWCRSV